MTLLSPENLLLLFLGGNLICLISLMLFSKRIRTEILPSQKDKSIWKCEFCLHTYLAQSQGQHARCPQCSCLNFKC